MTARRTAPAAVPGTAARCPADHDVQPPDRQREHPVTLRHPLRPADQAAQGQFGPALDRTHLVHVHRLGQPPPQQVTPVVAQPVPRAPRNRPAGPPSNIPSTHPPPPPLPPPPP